MAYSEKVKKEAQRLWLSGHSALEIAAKVGCNPDTINAWRHRYHWDVGEADSSVQHLKEKMAAISADSGELSDAQLRKVDKLSKAIRRMEQSVPKGRLRGTRRHKMPSFSVQTIGDIRTRILDGLYPYQRKFVQDEARFRICLKARQTGFSYSLGAEVLLGALARKENQIVVSASQDQSEIVRNYCIKWCNDLGVEYLEDKGNIIFPGGSTGYFLPCNWRTVQGYTGDVYLGEYAWHMAPAKMWLAVVPAITVGKKRLTITSTPYTEYDRFGEIWTQPSKYPRFSRHKVDIYRAIADGHRVDLEELRDLFDALTFAQAYECRFFADKMSLLSPAEVRDAFRDDALDMNTSAELNGGTDIGRYRDLTAVILSELRGEKKEQEVWVRHMDTLDKMSFQAQEDYIGSLFEIYRIRKMRIDRTGIGAQMAENLQMRYPGKVSGIWFTREIKEQLALGVKKLFEGRRIRIPNDRDLTMQLHAIRRKPTEKGFTYDADRNEEIKHADLFWALALSVMDAAGQRRVLTRRNILTIGG